MYRHVQKSQIVRISYSTSSHPFNCLEQKNSETGSDDAGGRHGALGHGLLQSR